MLKSHFYGNTLARFMLSSDWLSFTGFLVDVSVAFFNDSLGSNTKPSDQKVSCVLQHVVSVPLTHQRRQGNGVIKPAYLLIVSSCTQFNSPFMNSNQSRKGELVLLLRLTSNVCMIFPIAKTSA